MDIAMYRKQMKFQKLICFFLLAASALVFVYSLGLSTDLHDSLKSTMIYDNDYHNTPVSGAWIYYDIQPFNLSLTTAAIILILLSIVLFIFNNHSRRKYYFANYLPVGLSSTINVGISVWAIINVLKFRHQYVTTVDFEALKAYCEEWNTYYTDSTFWFDIAFLVFGLVIVATALNIFNAIWKSKLMKEEARIIKEGLEG
jgi:hypothetical protein